MTWNIKIKDPSGHPKLIPATGNMAIGRGTQCEILLRDTTLPEVIGQVWVKPNANPHESPFWFRVDESVSNVLLGNLEVREGRLPLGVPLDLGDSRIILQRNYEGAPLPNFPSGYRPWLTQSEAGK